MNEWGIYIALYCVSLYTQSALQSYEGVSLQPPPVQHFWWHATNPKPNPISNPIVSTC